MKKLRRYLKTGITRRHLPLLVRLFIIIRVNDSHTKRIEGIAKINELKSRVEVGKVLVSCGHEEKAGDENCMKSLKLSKALHTLISTLIVVQARQLNFHTPDLNLAHFYWHMSTIAQAYKRSVKSEDNSQKFFCENPVKC